MAVFLAGCATVKGPVSGKKYSSFAYDHRISDDPNDIFSYDKYAYLGQDYINEARHFYVNQNPDISEEIKSAILNGNLIVGMKPADVVATWGKPIEKNTTHAQDNKNEQWIYGDIDYDTALDRYVFIHNKKFAYLDNNILTAFQD